VPENRRRRRRHHHPDSIDDNPQLPSAAPRTGCRPPLRMRT